MLDELQNGAHDLSSLRRILVGGAEISAPTVAHYHAAGIDVFHGWGATEMSPSGSGTVLRAGRNDPRWGPAVAGVELRLAAPAGGFAPWDGVAVGELQARGPWVARAYLRPEDDANATRFTADGWFRTGDIARIQPDGAVEIVDREKDLVKSGGEWISSAELERALVAHPGVAEAVVIAIPDAEWGERPAALIVPAASGAPSPSELGDFLAERVARWWVPSVYEFVERAAEDERREIRQATAARRVRRPALRHRHRGLVVATRLEHPRAGEQRLHERRALRGRERREQLVLELADRRLAGREHPAARPRSAWCAGCARDPRTACARSAREPPARR